MSPTYCEVALPVPLRSLFTYEIPERLAGSVCAGSRVLVPFRNRAMTGVVVEASVRRPDPARVKNVREIVEVLDRDSGAAAETCWNWGAGWAATTWRRSGEVFRAMLPPQIDLRHEREFLMTDAGRARRAELDAAGNRSESEVAELALLSLMEIEGRPVRADRLRKLPGGEAAAERLLRRKQLEAREVAVRRAGARAENCRVERGSCEHSPRPMRAPLSPKKKRASFMFSRRNAVLCRCRNSQSLPKFRGRSIERMIRQEKLKCWEEPLAIEEDLFDADYTPPSNILNEDQERELASHSRLARCGRFYRGACSTASPAAGKRKCISAPSKRRWRGTRPR